MQFQTLCVLVSLVSGGSSVGQLDENLATLQLEWVKVNLLLSHQTNFISAQQAQWTSPNHSFFTVEQCTMRSFKIKIKLVRGVRLFTLCSNTACHSHAPSFRFNVLLYLPSPALVFLLLLFFFLLASPIRIVYNSTRSMQAMSVTACFNTFQVSILR